jgi:hypothetical protein
MHRDMKQGMKVKLPVSFEAALADGWHVCEENYTGELNRIGTIQLERIDRGTGDKETVDVPFVAKLEVGRPRKYRRLKHAYLTMEEAAQFSKELREAARQ